MWAIVPVKTFDRAKQRLANVLDQGERRSLMLAMARDVLTCLTGCTRISGILIVSRTAEADALAQSFGTERFAESPDAGLPEALRQATDYLIANFNAAGVMIVPADVPAIRAPEIDRILAEHEQVTILPDAENMGTNALVCSPPGCIPYIFDGQSFKPHVDAAFTVGITPRILPGTAFSLDVDVPDDLLSLQAAAPDSQTVNYLNKAGILARIAASSSTQTG